MNIVLPETDGARRAYALTQKRVEPVASPRFSRIAYAAAHVVADPLAMTDPWSKPALDWERTMAVRHHLWRLGFRIAEAMDTSQRGMGFDWQSAKELIRRSIAEAKTVEGADLASGAGTDQLAPLAARSLDDVIAAYDEQFGFIEGQGGKAIMMASRALAKVAKGADDYARVYDRILSQASGKVILHWLGAMFDPALKGYWGADDFEAALDTVVGIIERHAGKVEGIKISLLDADKEVALRDRLRDRHRQQRREPRQPALLLRHLLDVPLGARQADAQRIPEAEGAVVPAVVVHRPDRQPPPLPELRVDEPPHQRGVDPWAQLSRGHTAAAACRLPSGCGRAAARAVRWGPLRSRCAATCRPPAAD